MSEERITQVIDGEPRELILYRCPVCRQKLAATVTPLINGCFECGKKHRFILRDGVPVRTTWLGCQLCRRKIA